ncbi:MAG: hypothetical protein U0V48_18275 [Anaerolineales bacterium]
MFNRPAILIPWWDVSTFDTITAIILKALLMTSHNATPLHDAENWCGNSVWFERGGKGQNILILTEGDSTR